MMAWVVSAIVALISPPEPVPVRHIVIHNNHVTALAQAAVRTRLGLYEEAFCLVGLVRPNGAYHVLGVVRPQQRAWVDTIDERPASHVIRAPCPIGTIADLHTHPWSPNASDEDHASWAGARFHRVHLVLFALNTQRIAFQAHDYTDPAAPRALVGAWLVIVPNRN